MKIASKVKTLFFLISFIFIALSCSRKPSDILSKKEMEDILYDMYIMDAMSRSSFINANQAENRIEYVNGIMKKHNTTHGNFNKSLAWYSDNMTDLSTINEKIIQRFSVLDSAYIRLKKNFINYKFDKFDENMPKIFNLDDNNNIFSFRIDSMTIAQKKDIKSVNWRFDLIGIRNSSQIDASLILTFSDTIVNRKINNLSDGNYNLSYSFPQDSVNDSFGNLNDISGYIYLKDIKKQNKNIYLKDLEFKFDTISNN